MADQQFIYDGWNVVLVLDGRQGENNVVLQKYTWGLDLSGLNGGGAAGFSPRGPSVGASVTGIHGAGGIGGLLATENIAAGGEASNSYWYLYDGNGNVGQLLKASDQSVSAKYEYDPYGNSLVASGTYANTNPFRFSTKWRDTSNSYNWYYFGYRYYLPRLGRWITRDPLEIVLMQSSQECVAPLWDTENCECSQRLSTPSPGKRTATGRKWEVATGPIAPTTSMGSIPPWAPLSQRYSLIKQPQGAAAPDDGDGGLPDLHSLDDPGSIYAYAINDPISGSDPIGLSKGSCGNSSWCGRCSPAKPSMSCCQKGGNGNGTPVAHEGDYMLTICFYKNRKPWSLKCSKPLVCMRRWECQQTAHGMDWVPGDAN